MEDFSSPSPKVLAVTPSDSTNLSGVRALYVGSDGDVAVIAINNQSAVTFVGVPAGTILPLRVSRVMATNTTASNIVALY